MVDQSTDTGRVSTPTEMIDVGREDESPDPSRAYFAGESSSGRETPSAAATLISVATVGFAVRASIRRRCTGSILISSAACSTVQPRSRLSERTRRASTSIWRRYAGFFLWCAVLGSPGLGRFGVTGG